MLLKVNKNIGNINVSFTPNFYKQAYKNYQNGDYRYLLALIEHAEIDSFISGCLTARHAGYKRNFEIKPASENAADKAAAEFIAEIFERLFAREFFEDMIDARMKYYSVLALEWDIQGGKQIITSYKKEDQKYFRYDPDDGILKIDFGKILKPIPEGSAFVLQSSRKPIMLKVLKDYIRKEFGEHNWSSFIEVFGEAFIIGEYPPGATPEQKKDVEDGVNAIAQSTRGIVPEGTKINIIESKRSTGDQKDYVQDCKEGISVALLGHKDAAGSDKSMQIGDNTSGIEVKKSIAVDDMFWLEEKMSGFIKMICDRNFMLKAYPKIVFDKSDSVDHQTKLDALTIALDAGAEVDPKFCLEYGIPILNMDKPLKKNSIFEDLNQG